LAGFEEEVEEAVELSGRRVVVVVAALGVDRETELIVEFFVLLDDGSMVWTIVHCLEEDASESWSVVRVRDCEAIESSGVVEVL
jgi:hypothetical protein